MHQNLRPWWQRDSKPVADMLDEAEAAYLPLEAKGDHFDTELTADLTKTAGAHYAWLCTLAYRQSIAAHSLVAGPDGKPMLFAKENFSNGDVGTVDVLYPYRAHLPLLQPAPARRPGSPRPRLRRQPQPLALPLRPARPRPVPPCQRPELRRRRKNRRRPDARRGESGNLILCVDAIARLGNSTELAETYWPQLTQWALFLKQHGLDPENQLTTDDFAGHVTHNANLALKAIDALAAYADLARILHHESRSEGVRSPRQGPTPHKWITARSRRRPLQARLRQPRNLVAKVQPRLGQGARLQPLPTPASAPPRSPSTKPSSTSTAFPLDSRKSYTKLDWTLWTATLTDNQADFDALVDPAWLWSTGNHQAASRMTDWYDTITGKQDWLPGPLRRRRPLHPRPRRQTPRRPRPSPEVNHRAPHVAPLRHGLDQKGVSTQSRVPSAFFNTTSIQHPNSNRNPNMPNRKSVILALLLTFFFGPFGMFYSTVVGALVMLVLYVALGIPTLGWAIAGLHPSHDLGRMGRPPRQPISIAVDLPEGTVEELECAVPQAASLFPLIPQPHLQRTSPIRRQLLTPTRIAQRLPVPIIHTLPEIRSIRMRRHQHIARHRIQKLEAFLKPRQRAPDDRQTCTPPATQPSRYRHTPSHSSGRPRTTSTSSSPHPPYAPA